MITVNGGIVMKSFPAFLALPFCVCSFSSQAAPDPCISELKIIQHSLEAEGGWHGPIANDPNDNGWLRWIEIIPGIHKDKNNRVVCKAIGTYYGDYYPGVQMGRILIIQDASGIQDN